MKMFQVFFKSSKRFSVRRIVRTEDEKTSIETSRLQSKPANDLSTTSLTVIPCLDKFQVKVK